MTVLLTIISISSMVLNNCLANKVVKKELTTNNQIGLFNLLGYLVCIVLFGIFAEGMSWFTAGLGVVFGLATNLNTFYKLKALNEGPMHLTLLITTSSMIIPTLSGVFFGEAFSWKKLVAMAVLIFFIYLSLGRTDGKKTNGRWFVYCLISFVFCGAVGVLQKIHQASAYKNETNALLFVAFLFSIVFARLAVKGKLKEISLGKKNIIFAGICGLCIYAMNYINLRLSGMLPAQLFFPLVNGSAIVLSSLASVLLFKEKLSGKQLVGLVGGILSLIAICLV